MFDGALVRAYAKPLLCALVVYVLTSKLVALVNIAAPSLAPAERDKLAAGLVAARNAVADACIPEEASLRSLLGNIGRAMNMFRTGAGPAAAAGLYQPLTTVAVHQIPAEIDNSWVRLRRASGGGWLAWDGVEIRCLDRDRRRRRRSSGQCRAPNQQHRRGKNILRG